MKIPNSRTASRGIALAALLLSAACTDRNPAAPAVTPPPGQEVRAQIACTVSVADQAMRCGAPSPTGGGAQDIILGGQGTYVRLESANVAYDSVAGSFSLDVTVQNLLAQPMGTPDGETASGVRVFFEQMPTATEGAGEISVANADGTGSFTRIAQPYFEYPQILEPRGSSQPRPWRFVVPASVDGFAFTVYVHTQLPAEQAALRWVQERGYVSVLPFNAADIWGAGPSSLFAVGDSIILHDDGTGWQPMPHPGGQTYLYDIHGSSRYQVFAVGHDGTILKYDGNRWSLRARGPAGEGYSLRGVWSGGNDVYAVGSARISGEGRTLVMRSHDGGDTWTTTTPGFGGMAEVWASGDHVYAVGGCTILHSADRGATWLRIAPPMSPGCTLNSVTGTGTGDVTAAGGFLNASTNLWEALVLRSTDGGVTWRDTLIAGPNGRSVASLSAVPGGGMYAAGYRGTLLRLDGDTWTDLTSNPPPLVSSLFLSFTGVWAGSASNVHVVGFETRFRFDGATWTREALNVPTLEMLQSVHGSGSAVFAAGARETTQAIPTALVLRSTGAGWVQSFAASADSTRFTGVWSASADEAYAVGYQNLPEGTAPLGWRYAGGEWTEIAFPPTSARTVLDAVTGTGRGAVTVLGHVPGAAGGSSALAILRSADGGASWGETELAYTGARTPTIAKAWTSGDEVWAVGYGGDVGAGDYPGLPPRPTAENEAFLLHYDGQQWTLVEVVPGRVYRGVWSEGNHVYVSGYEDAGRAYRGFLRYSSNGGDTWTEFTAPVNRSAGMLTDVWASSPSEVYVVGYLGTVLRFDGTRWLEGSAPSRPALYSLWGSSARDLYAVGDRGLILHGTR